MLRTRLWMGALLIVSLVVSLWVDELLGPPFPAGVPAYPCWLLIAVLGVFGASRELCQLLARREIQVPTRLATSGVIAVVAANWLPWLWGPGKHLDHLASALSTVCVVNMVVFVWEGLRFRAPGTAVTAIGGSLLITFYLGALASFLVELRWLPHGLLALATHIAAVKSGDTGAYFGGRALGRHKLCPWLSPNKTVEGAVVGLASSTLGACLVVLAAAKLTGKPAVMSLLVSAGFGLLVGALGMVGDLVESLIKRDCQQKDASNIVPGFGGILDVLDSPLFSAPLAYTLWFWLVP